MKIPQHVLEAMSIGTLVATLAGCGSMSVDPEHNSAGKDEAVTSEPAVTPPSVPLVDRAPAPTRAAPGIDAPLPTASPVNPITVHPSRKATVAATTIHLPTKHPNKWPPGTIGHPPTIRLSAHYCPPCGMG